MRKTRRERGGRGGEIEIERESWPSQDLGPLHKLCWQKKHQDHDCGHESGDHHDVLHIQYGSTASHVVAIPYAGKVETSDFFPALISRETRVQEKKHHNNTSHNSVTACCAFWSPSMIVALKDMIRHLHRLKQESPREGTQMTNLWVVEQDTERERWVGWLLHRMATSPESWSFWTSTSLYQSLDTQFTRVSNYQHLQQLLTIIVKSAVNGHPKLLVERLLIVNEESSLPIVKTKQTPRKANNSSCFMTRKRQEVRKSPSSHAKNWQKAANSEQCIHCWDTRSGHTKRKGCACKVNKWSYLPTNKQQLSDNPLMQGTNCY